MISISLYLYLNYYFLGYVVNKDNFVQRNKKICIYEILRIILLLSIISQKNKQNKQNKKI